jgi:hypothetical protein
LDDEDEEGEIPLPENGATQRRISGRALKRPRKDEEIFVYSKP